MIANLLDIARALNAGALVVIETVEARLAEEHHANRRVRAAEREHAS